MPDTRILSIAGEALVIRPGDTLILRVDRKVSLDEINDLGTQMKRYLPDVKVVILDGVEQMAAYRPDELQSVTESGGEDRLGPGGDPNP